jgi:hypothetical protein
MSVIVEQRREHRLHNKQQATRLHRTASPAGDEDDDDDDDDDDEDEAHRGWDSNHVTATYKLGVWSSMTAAAAAADATD